MEMDARRGKRSKNAASAVVAESERRTSLWWWWREGGAKRLAEPVTHWAEVLVGSADGDGTSARWVCVVPHTATAVPGASNQRWSFAAGGASVDKPDDVAASRRSQHHLPYVVGFRGSGGAGVGAGADMGVGVGAKDLTRKYAAIFSQVLPHRTDLEWWSDTLTPLVRRESSLDNVSPSGLANKAVADDTAAAAAARVAGETEDFEMDTKSLTERVPTTLAEVKNHPLWVVERFLTKTQMIHPRHPIKGLSLVSVFSRARASKSCDPPSDGKRDAA